MIKPIQLFLFFCCFSFAVAIAQPTHPHSAIEQKYLKAKAFVLAEDYALAYPILKELKGQLHEMHQSNEAFSTEDVMYSYILCELKMMLNTAPENAEAFILQRISEPRKQLMQFHLAHYYFVNNAFDKAAQHFETVSFDQLTNEQLADAKFEKAYCYFNQKRFDAAKGLFDEIHQIPTHKYYFPANYYYGFIAYYQKDYAAALQSFLLVESDPSYAQVVPYYITDLYYSKGDKERALQYGSAALDKGVGNYYEKDLQLLLGQLYFEKNDFAKALPLIEYYAGRTKDISKEVLYELSFCYYSTQQTAKAIEGFKQLSSSKDSLGQNSMYLLGGLYLQQEDKISARNAFQYCAFNNSNTTQQRISRFNYAKISYELGFQDIALQEMKLYLTDYPAADNQAEAKELLIHMLANTNNFKEALEIFQSMGRPTPSMQKIYPRLLYGRAMEYINDQRADLADSALAGITSLSITDPVIYYAHFWRAELAYRNQQYDRSLEWMLLYLQGNPPAQGEVNLATARYICGYSLFQQKQYAKALGYFEQFARAAPSSGNIQQDAFYRMADCFYMLKNYSRALSLYEMAIDNKLSAADYALYQKAMIVGIKSSKEKIWYLNALADHFPNSNLLLDAQMEIAATYLSDEKFANAIPYLNNVIASNQAAGLKPKALLKLGLAYYNNNDNQNALVAFKELIRLYPQSTETDEACSVIKDIYVEEGRPDEYVDLFRANGIQVSVSEADSLSYSSALAKFQAGDCSAANNGFANYLTRYSTGSYVLEANYYLGLCSQKSSDWPNLIKYFGYVNSKGVSKYFEAATLALARTYYFELKDYTIARNYFESLQLNANLPENKLEALRGLIRCYYQLKDYLVANNIAIELLSSKGISTDDKAIGFLVLGKSQQMSNDCSNAVASFKSCAAINKGIWGAEARYETAACYFSMDNFSAAEKAAMSVIKETGSYDFWLTKSYILLGDLFVKKKDFFNAKATFESVAKNASVVALKEEAQQKYNQVVAYEQQGIK